VVFMKYILSEKLRFKVNILFSYPHLIEHGLGQIFRGYPDG